MKEEHFERFCKKCKSLSLTLLNGENGLERCRCVNAFLLDYPNSYPAMTPAAKKINPKIGETEMFRYASKIGFDWYKTVVDPEFIPPHDCPYILEMTVDG